MKWSLLGHFDILERQYFWNTIMSWMHKNRRLFPTYVYMYISHAFLPSGVWLGCLVVTHSIIWQCNTGLSVRYNELQQGLVAEQHMKDTFQTFSASIPYKSRGTCSLCHSPRARSRRGNHRQPQRPIQLRQIPVGL